MAWLDALFLALLGAAALSAIYLTEWWTRPACLSSGKAEASEDSPGSDLSLQTLEYWGARFEELGVKRWAGCTFEAYLQRPRYYERIAQVRRDAAQRRLDLTGRGGRQARA